MAAMLGAHSSSTITPAIQFAGSLPSRTRARAASITSGGIMPTTSQTPNGSRITSWRDQESLRPTFALTGARASAPRAVALRAVAPTVAVKLEAIPIPHAKRLDDEDRTEDDCGRCLAGGTCKGIHRLQRLSPGRFHRSDRANAVRGFSWAPGPFFLPDRSGASARRPVGHMRLRPQHEPDRATVLQ